ncbi:MULTISPECIES: PilZ domain-containing protein [unclassified Novosphingobium]|uniref:PilZ domain-containing protein n=1 Tax=unclassified Novosphingobium TaxID=2644732 RepID=UPI0025D45EAD|nr:MULTISPECIES: PilZ domain-containing protein [unclassified Novosphingobium]HQV02725.1 PilZ domain-containing protein [Novosphingobium sp.]
MNQISPVPTHEASSNRASQRATLCIRCEVRQGTRPWQMVVLDDLSPKGFRISGLAHADQAKPLSIRLPRMQLLTARLCWVAGPVVGCEFTAPLHVAVFEHLVRKAQTN